MPCSPGLWGAKEQERADRAANTGIFLALASFVVFAIVGALFSRTFFLLQTDVPEIVDYGTDYAWVCLCCSIGLFCQFTFERLLQSTGRTHLSMCTQILGGGGPTSSWTPSSSSACWASPGWR